MPIELTFVEARVLGCLIEKEMATPEYYPLSLNALTNACNQKSNRDPVVSYDDETVADAIEGLKSKQLAWAISGRDMRVPKYSHRASESLNAGNRELAVLSVLLLRGPQTVGEIKERTGRLYTFDDIEGVENVLKRLMERQPEPLVAQLPRQPGTREPRFAQLLTGPVDLSPTGPATAAFSQPADSLSARVARLEEEVDTLKRHVEELRQLLM